MRRNSRGIHVPAELAIEGQVEVTVWGGLGNRLFMLAAGFSMARSLDRPLVVLSHHQETLSDVVGGLDADRLFMALKHRPRVVLLPPIRHSRFVRAKQKARNLGSRAHLIAESPVGSGRVRRTTSEKGEILALEGYFQDFAIVRQAVALGWPTVPPLSASDESWVASLSAREQRGVGVHVRRGDYLDKINRFRLGSPDVSYYRSALQKLKARLDAPLWLFSDDPNGARDFLAAGGIQVDKAFGPEDSPSEAAALGLMGTAAGLVLSNSTFSWWGAFWGQPPLGVVYPQPWHDKVNAGTLGNPLWMAVAKRP